MPLQYCLFGCFCSPRLSGLVYVIFFRVYRRCGHDFGGASYEVKLPAFKGFVTASGDWLWPLLFITVACGAISGFHSLVASGTTSKQLKRETDAVPVGYGAMRWKVLLALLRWVRL
ncbi:MAG: carbon starvation CstA family protein [Phascolarctobacterium faecium]